MNEVLVLGIDPAPAKNTVIYNGTAFDEIKAEELAEKLIEITSSNNVLLCWDAPLTGPHACKKNITNAFSKRPIEAFFTRDRYNFTVPPGISVMGYSGCPHWAITKSVLGLPKIGQYEQVIEAPFQLITSGLYSSGKCVVEVHPAVAIWLWCSQEYKLEKWAYKKEDGVFKTIIAILLDLKIMDNDIILEMQKAKTQGIASDDALDAYIAWYLGNQYLQTKPSHHVSLIGNASTGAWLLPNVKNQDKDLSSEFDFFISENQCE